MGKPILIPSVKYLKECFVYDARRGLLFWKKRPKKHFTSEWAWGVWNKRYAGTEAFITLRKGYKCSHIDGQAYQLHRIIWKLETGKEPPSVLDHVNRNPRDNRFRNLRSATHAQNVFHRSRRTNNSSGRMGVYARRGRWYAYITLDYEQKWLGSYATFAEAVAVRRKAERVHFGEFAA